MTDLPMDPTEHPDEGLIHAWLDDALGATEAERIAAHVRTCAECQARVAEARGLIAGASRIVAALDDAPAAGRPAWAQAALAEGGAARGAAAAGSASAPRGSLWRWLRVTPGRAAAAATILVAIGITLTYEKVGMDTAPRSVASVLNPQRSDVPATTSPEGGAADGVKPSDEILDSALARNVAIAQGRRTMEAARGPNVPAAPPPSTTLQAPVGAAGEAVALGRASAEAARESAPVAPDRSRTAVGGAAPQRRELTGAVASITPPTANAPAPIDRQQAGVTEQMAARSRADQPAPRASQPSEPFAAATAGAELMKVSGNAVARSCFRLDSPDADARWADQSFPLVLAVEPGLAGEARDAAVLTPAGGTTQLRARWSPRGGDSVSVTLRRLGYSGSIVLGPGAVARSGLAVSAAAPTRLEDLYTADARAKTRARADADGAESRRAAAGAAPQAAPAPGPPVRQLRVTARGIACPAG